MPREYPPVILHPLMHGKMLYLCNKSDREVGGFGVSPADNPLQINNIRILKQETSTASIDFDEDALADYFAEMAGKGFSYDQIGRLWIHTHPGNSATPSGTDRTTFRELIDHQYEEFTRAKKLGVAVDKIPDPWLIMLILGNVGALYAEIGGLVQGRMVSSKIEVCSVWDARYRSKWDKEFKENVTKATPLAVHHWGGVTQEVGSHRSQRSGGFNLTRDDPTDPPSGLMAGVPTHDSHSTSGQQSKRGSKRKNKRATRKEMGNLRVDLKNVPREKIPKLDTEELRAIVKSSAHLILGRDAHPLTDKDVNDLDRDDLIDLAICLTGSVGIVSGGVGG